ncbi:MAG: hypothetical protein IKM94_03390, partial [Alphaproteobacteria bacterium]|nr:hypothetical protein [Alphaproteobacteria bacterium]
MKRLFVMGLLFVFMAVMPVFHAVADNNQCRNLFDVDTMLVEKKAIRAGSVSADKPLGSEMDATNWNCTDYISVLPDTTYTYTIPSSVAAGAAGMVFYSDKSVDGAISGITQGSSLTRTFTTPPNCQYVRFSWVSSHGNDVQLGQ